MDAVVREEVLSQCRHVVVGLDKRVQGVDPLVRCGRGVGLLAVELDRESLSCEKSRVGKVSNAGMDQHRGCRVVEGPGVDQVDLAPFSLLRGGSEDGDPDPKFLGQTGQGSPGADRGRRDYVVTASMSDAWQRVVLAADDDSGTARSGLRLKGGVEPVGRVADLKTVVTEKSGQPS